MKPLRTNRILELDGLRALAVTVVVIFHMANFAGSVPKGPYWVAEMVTCVGPIGVNVFFIISGFIITTLLLREQLTAGFVSLRAFYVRRFFRIVPPFLAYLVVLMILGVLHRISVSTRNLIWSALFLGNVGLFDSQEWFVAHTWSLSVEEQFYIIFPPLLCIVFCFRAGTTLLTLWLAYALSLTSLKIAHELSLHVNPNWICLAGLYHFRYIIVGVMCALNGRPVLAFLNDRSRIIPLLLALLIILLRRIQTPSAAGSVITAALEPFFCGLFVMWFVHNPARCTFLRWPAVQWIGACSYSIYLWQQLFTGPASLYHEWCVPQYPLAAAAILMCAVLSHYCIERPSIRLGRFLSKRYRKRRADLQNHVALDAPPVLETPTE